MQKKIFSRGLGLFVFTFLIFTYSALPVHAQQETGTAGSQSGKEVAAEQDATRYGSPGQGSWKQNSIGWWYEYADGSYPERSWRKIDGTWYYFNQDGYWVDNNVHEAGTLKGIDVSQWQGAIDWQAVKDDGIQFAFVRVGHGEHNLDTYYNRNMQGANAVGLPVGVYFYSTATSRTEALSDAQFVIESMKGYQVSYPVVIDLEDREQDGLSKLELARIAQVYSDEIRAAGYTPMLYCNENWYRNRIEISALSNVEMWIANYNVVHSEAIPRNIWQCCSTGRVAGITGNVDIDFGYTDYTQLIVPRTAPAEGYSPSKGVWEQDAAGYWYRYSAGGYPKEKWEYIQGAWYWFDANGYMATGWQNLGGKWYYLSGSGAMHTGWLKQGDIWYYLQGSGAMGTGWQSVGGTWYYLQGSGAMHTGWLKLGDVWYYLQGSGAMHTGWLKLGDTWYYLNESGAMHAGWKKLGDTWYYLLGDGSMAVGWLNVGGVWYYLDESGAMRTGWLRLGDTWYYLDGSGAMQANKWIGNYWVRADGAMAVSGRVDNDRYYVDENGRWVPGM